MNTTTQPGKIKAAAVIGAGLSESVTKQGEKWGIQTSKLVENLTGYALERETWFFDAVVVAVGRYGEPRVPDTNHSKVYESARDTRVDFRGHSNHENAEKVAMAIEFTTVTFNSHTLDDDDPIPGKVVLQDGRVLEGIHYVIIATGYHTTFPFIGPLLEQPSTAFEDADENVITTSDGRTAHNLHEDTFYIPDPTLAFIGITHFASTFSMYDFQAQVLAAVFADTPFP